MKKNNLKRFSVLLLYPDYMRADEAETYLAHVVAKDPEKAIAKAQKKAAKPNDVDSPDDFLPLLCCEGHVEDLSTRGQNYMDRS
jgi:hypothetical protein